ncbi:MAG TPA: PDZ domain-containing protein, partial [Terracidiphilus sp.]
MASKLHSDGGHVGATAPLRRVHQPPAPMARDLQTRFFAVFLALLSVAAIVFAWINFQKEREFVAPYDGVWWVEDAGHLRAERVDTDGPGQKAGIKGGDRLVAVDGHN